MEKPQFPYYFLVGSKKLVISWFWVWVFPFLAAAEAYEVFGVDFTDWSNFIIPCWEEEEDTEGHSVSDSFEVFIFSVGVVFPVWGLPVVVFETHPPTFPPLGSDWASGFERLGDGLTKLLPKSGKFVFSRLNPPSLFPPKARLKFWGCLGIAPCLRCCCSVGLDWSPGASGCAAADSESENQVQKYKVVCRWKKLISSQT